MKILMVDDDIKLLSVADAILQALGHRTTHSVDASQVLPSAQREKPDLILLDINMPGGNGTDLLMRLKRSSLTSGIPVIVISGSQEPGIRDRVAKLGAGGFIAKPWMVETFAQELKRLTPYLPW